MNRTKARLSFISRLEEFFAITYKEEILFEHGIFRTKLTFDPELYPCTGTNNLYIEGCIHWYQEVARVNIYYSAAGAVVVAKNKDNLGALFRVFNFISSEIWPLVDDTTGSIIITPLRCCTAQEYLLLKMITTIFACHFCFIIISSM